MHVKEMERTNEITMKDLIKTREKINIQNTQPARRVVLYEIHHPLMYILEILVPRSHCAVKKNFPGKKFPRENTLFVPIGQTPPPQMISFETR